LLLRASGEQTNNSYDINAVTSASGDAGVEHGAWLRALSEQTIRGEWAALADTRIAAAAAMGHQQCVDALTVAAAFNGITRVADATGIPLDHNTDDATADLRSATGIDEFHYSAKTARYD
jgi:hypothetical protein